MVRRHLYIESGSRPSLAIMLTRWQNLEGNLTQNNKKNIWKRCISRWHLQNLGHFVWPLYVKIANSFTSCFTKLSNPSLAKSVLTTNDVSAKSEFCYGGGWGYEVSCGGHHRPRGKTATGSVLDGAVFDIAQILAYLVRNMSRSQLYLGFGHFDWLPSFLIKNILAGLWLNCISSVEITLFFSGWHIIAA